MDCKDCGCILGCVGDDHIDKLCSSCIDLRSGLCKDGHCRRIDY